MFEKGKWYDQDGTYSAFNGPAESLDTSIDSGEDLCGEFGCGLWYFTRHFHEVPAPTIGHVEKLDQSINDRLARLKEIDQQIADFLAHCEGGRVEEVIPADTRESIRVIFTRG